MSCGGSGGIVCTLSKKSIYGMMKQYSRMNCDWVDSTCAMITGPNEKNGVKKVTYTPEASNVYILELDPEKIGNDFIQYGPIQYVEDESSQVKQKGRKIKRKEMHKRIRNNVEASAFLECGPSPEITLQYVLSNICPPKQWRCRGQILRQNVSNKIPTRRDVVALKEKAVAEFLAYKNIITEDGMCTLRRELNGKIFDEIIRQVSVQCVERGHQLIKIRDQYYHQFERYETVFCSLIAYTARKILLSKKRSSDLREKIGEIQEQISELEEINSEFPQAIEFVENKFEEEQLEDDCIYNEEYEKVLRTNQQLKKLLLFNSVNILQTKSEMI